MTSVPKPLKFLGPHYETLKDVCEKIAADADKKLCAVCMYIAARFYIDTMFYICITYIYINKLYKEIYICMYIYI